MEGKFRQWVPTDSPIVFSTDDLYKSLFRDLRVAGESYELSSPANGNPPNILRVGLSDMDSALMAAADPGFVHWLTFPFCSFWSDEKFFHRSNLF